MCYRNLAERMHTVITIEFEFPVKKDAYKFRNDVNNFFSGSFFEEKDQIDISPVIKHQDDSRDVWRFKIMFRKDKTDIDVIEKYVKISGGTLDLMNGSRQVWAFA